MDALGELIFGLILGAVQGITEFFPISSSGHLAIIQIFADKMGYGHVLGKEAIAFNVAVHGASLAAIVIVVRDDIKRIILHERRLLLMLLIATVPAGLVGVLLKSHIEDAFGSLNAVGLALIATGLMLILVEWKKPGDRSVSQTGLADALIIGCGQAVAIMPGLSRSGCTIGAGLLRRLSRDEAVRYSFLMAIPAIGGVCCYDLLTHLLKGADAWSGIPAPIFISGTVSSFVFSLLALTGLLKLVRRHKLSWFAIWCIPLGAIILIVHFLST